ncbi:hypothetical protein BKA61DRAFT_649362 [Leptodontidium sp. MPI-SDFR-AT-0119]|nr:hypothetical protein BKA61DRAFT_649362 [Leptodontidium sp. MPI-SDFR-AT-0119]
MAEVLAVVASGISVVQLAGQLLNCVHQLRIFYRTIRDIPEELQQVLNEVEILGQILSQLGTLSPNDPGTSALQASLEHCRRAVSTLGKMATRSQGLLGRNNRKLNLVRVALRKDELKELKVQLEAAKSLLHLSMTCYSINAQQQQITLMEVRKIEDSDKSARNGLKSRREGARVNLRPKDLNLLARQHSSRQGLDMFSSCSLNKCCCACHTSKTITGRFWSAKIPWFPIWNACDKSSCGCYRKASIWISLNAIGIPYAIIANLDILLTSQRSYISPSLQAKRVVNWESPAFALLWEMRWNEMEFVDTRRALTELFSSGQASPIDILPNGKSLTERLLTVPWPNGDTQLKLLEFLVHSGSELNNSSTLINCSRWKGTGPWRTGLDNHSGAHNQLLNRLLALGFDPSEVEPPSLYSWPKECSPMPSGEWNLGHDPFFIDWIAQGVKALPGFLGSSSLHEAILTGSVQAVNDCLYTHDSKVTDRNFLKQSSVHLAVWRPQHLQSLMNAGFDINARDWIGRTPLMYAAVAGLADVAISLFDAGADPSLKDNLYAHHDFIRYAVLSNHFHVVIEVLKFARQSPNFPAAYVSSLLDNAVINWAGQGWTGNHWWTNRSESLEILLKLGANPEIRFSDGWEWHEETDNTLLHRISSTLEFDILVASGFKSFAHSNSSGASGLMKIVPLSDPLLIEKCIRGGCSVAHQDVLGRTPLHVSAEELWESFVPLSWEVWPWGDRDRTLRSLRVLLHEGSDPGKGDNCQCACSTNGCTADNVLLKEYKRDWEGPIHTGYPLAQYILGLEWIQILQEVKGPGYATASVLRMLRLVAFEEMELTHTCCRKPLGRRKESWTTLDGDEVEEIMDEERELIEELEAHMRSVESVADHDLEDLLLQELGKLVTKRGAAYVVRPGYGQQPFEVRDYLERFCDIIVLS